MYNANYMDGVPVKIAERYKPPPAIYNVSQSLLNKLNLEDNYYENSPLYSYNLQLEQKALSKIDQWKRIRARNKELRRERIERREQQRIREDEFRQKNLLCSVSYPSTDDLSSSSGGEDENNEENNMNHKENGRAITESKETVPQINVSETTNSFHNILQPTVLSNSSNSSSNSVRSDLASLIKTNFEGKLSNSFNYKDFEEDTSSPFDNIELKTINDLDVLAQVLHNTRIKSSQPNVEELHETTTSTQEDNTPTISSDPEQYDNVSELPQPASLLCQSIPKPNNNSLPKYYYELSSTQEAVTPLRDHYTTTAINNANLPTLLPQYKLHYQGLNNANEYYSLNPNHSVDCNFQNTLNVGASQLHVLQEDQVTKSKSVPDILKELRDEIRNSEIRRSRNYSYNMQETIKNYDESNATTTTTTTHGTIDATEKCDIFSQLDDKGKQLAQQISAMGFPQSRVVRIVQLIGADDKKIIEHLIPLSELADLGFDETQISEALIRHENNKNKALDDLIS